MKTKFYPANTILLEALCDNCGGILQFVHSDFSRDPLCWLHTCNKCGKSYWLDNRYPYPSYTVDIAHPLNMESPDAKCEESN